MAKTKMSIKPTTERLPFLVAKENSEKIADILKVVSEEVFVGGSICRQSETCGDIDIAVVSDGNNTKILDVFSSLGQVIMKGEVMARIAYEFNPGKLVQVDLWIFPRYNWGAGCMFVAGNGTLNIWQRFTARKQGYNLGFCLKEISTNKVIALPTEQAVYDFLKWNWIPYKERSV